MAEYQPPENFDHADDFVEAVAKLKGMIERETAHRRGNQSDADQRADHGYTMQDVPVRSRLKEVIAACLVAYPTHTGATAAAMLTVYYGDLPPELRWRDRSKPRLVHDAVRAAIPVA